MLQPNGPLPPEIYWRRRALAIGAAVVVLGLIVWFISSLSGRNSDPEADLAGVASSSAPQTLPSAGSTPEQGAAANSAGGGSGGSSGGGSGESGASASGASATSGSASATSTGASAAAVVPAGQCPDQSLAIKATPDKPTYAVGEEPGFTVLITNISSTECQRDVGAGLQQALVYTLDNQRIWSNTDCFPNAQSDLRAFKPGEQAGFTVKWSGTNSVPGCAEARIPVGPGAYQVIAQLGELRSTPEPFNMS